MEREQESDSHIDITTKRRKHDTMSRQMENNAARGSKKVVLDDNESEKRQETSKVGDSKNLYQLQNQNLTW